MGKRRKHLHKKSIADTAPVITASWHWADTVGMCIIIFLCIIIYGHSLTNGYIWDDDQYLYDNGWVTHMDGLKDIWFSYKMPQYYPLVFTSFWLEHKLWGLNPFIYHLDNLILHILNAILLFVLVKKLNSKLIQHWKLI